MSTSSSLASSLSDVTARYDSDSDSDSGHESNYDNRESQLINFVNIADAIPQLSQQIRIYGHYREVITVSDISAGSKVKDKLIAVGSDSSWKNAYTYFESSTLSGLKLKDLTYKIYLWDNHVAFTMKHPITDEERLIYMHNRRTTI